MGKSKDLISGNQMDNTVAKLYSLRAGLSVISERADDIRKLESDISNEQARIKPIEKEISNNDYAIFKLRKNIASNEESISELQSKVPQTAKSLGEYLGELVVGDLHLRYIIPGVLLIIVGIVLLYFALTVYEALIGFAFLAFLVGVPLSLVLLVDLFSARKKRKSELTRIQNRTETDKKSIIDKQKQIEEYNNSIADIQIVNENLYAQKKDTEIQIEQHVSELTNSISAVVKEATLYNKVLVNEYTSLLNPADWHNTDLCIFYLQTGRADSIKECLLLADRQRQNDEIVGTIKAAGDRICGEIRSGFTALGSTMVACINALSMQIDSLGNSLSAQHNDTMNALSIIENSNTALLSATQLNNALQAKANETSEALLRDYKYVQNRMGIAI